MNNLIHIKDLPHILQDQLNTKFSERTIRNWGWKGVDGITLRTSKIGGRVYTTMSDVNEFFAKLNEKQEQEQAAE